MLVLLVKRWGGEALMLPKYHYDSHPIEIVWGRSKWWVRIN